MSANFTGSLPTVGIRVTMADDFTSAGNNINSTMRNMMGTASAYANAATNVASANIGWVASGYMLSNQLMGMVDRGAKVIQTTAAVGAAADATMGELKSLRKLGSEIAQDSPFGPQKVFEGMREFALAGYKTQDLLSLMKPAVTLAAANNAQLEGTGGSIELMINTMQAFNIAGSQATRVSDMLARAAVDSNTNLMDLRESLKMVSTTASMLGVPLEEILAFTMVLGNMGLKGTMGGVGMENFLRYLMTATNQLKFGDVKKGGKMMEAIGLTPEDILTPQGNLKSLVDILGSFKTALSGMDSSTQFKILHDIFQVRGLRAGGKAIQALDQMKSFLNSVQNADGTGLRMMERTMDNMGGTIQKTRATWAQFEPDFTTALTPLLRPLLEITRSIVQVMSWITQIPFIGSGITTLVTALISMKAILWGYRSLLTLVGAGQYSVGASGKSTGASLVASWTSAKAAVNGYIASVKAAYYAGAYSTSPTGMAATAAASRIFAMGPGGIYRRDPVSGGTTLVAGMRHAANINGMAAIQTAKNGRLYYRNAQGGITWMSKNMANTVKRGMASSIAAGTGVLAAGGVGQTILKGGRIASMLRGGMALMGGPWGLALTALTFLPGIISSIRANSDSTDENTKATLEASEASREYISFLMNQGQGFKQSRKLFEQMGDDRSSTEDYRLAKEKKEYLLHPERFGTNKPFFDFTQRGVVNVYVNGNFQKSFKEQFRKEMSAEVDMLNY